MAEVMRPHWTETLPQTPGEVEERLPNLSVVRIVRAHEAYPPYHQEELAVVDHQGVDPLDRKTHIVGLHVDKATSPAGIVWTLPFESVLQGSFQDGQAVFNLVFDGFANDEKYRDKRWSGIYPEDFASQ